MQNRPTLRLAALLLLLGSMLGIDAQALTLGRLRVVSTIGQPLVAEIDIPELTTEEANSLRIGVASPEAFKSAGLDYNPVTASMTVSGKRRADGRAYVELRTPGPVQESFLDLVLEVTWASGRLVRDYTLLLDGAVPASIQPMPTGQNLPSQTVPGFSASTGSSVVPSVTVPPVQTPAPVAAAAPAPSARPPNSRVAAEPVVTSGLSGFSFSTGQAAASQLQPSSQRTVNETQANADGKRGTKKNPAKSTTTKTANVKAIEVQKGNTASSIAQANLPAGVSLDQMLVAMLSANPEAFIDGNINRLKAGAVLDIPSADEAKSVSAEQIAQTLQAQDFNAYRQKLAQSTTTTSQTQKSRETKGSVTAKVDEKRAAATSPDKLTLSKGSSSKDGSQAEDKIAKDRASADTAYRSQQIQRNINELGKLGATSGVGMATQAAPTPNAHTPADGAASQASTATVPAALTSPSVAQASPPPNASAPTVPTGTTDSKSDPNLLENLASSIWALPFAGGVVLLAMLAALWRRRKNAAAQEQSQHTLFGATQSLESDPQQTVTSSSQLDTVELGGASTIVYPPSQLGGVGASGDVDPIAEADVYLAYNRDVQAEEILKEAKRQHPNRVAVSAKLLEIYAKRHDLESFDACANDLHRVTEGVGPEWSRARELAREIGSNSTLFTVSASAFAVSESAIQQMAYNNNSLSFMPQTLDLVGGGLQVPPLPAAGAIPMHQASAATASTPSVGTTGLIDFDLSGLSLDLPSNSDQPANSNSNTFAGFEAQASAPATVQAGSAFSQFAMQGLNPKIALAEEYLSIGDQFGAKSLLEDVARTADPQSAQIAQQMLSKFA